MENSEGKQGRPAGEVEDAQSNNCDSTGRIPDWGLKALPITEISDKDYRSFCWPCYAFEETGDDEPGG